jgi:hypothetical protein
MNNIQKFNRIRSFSTNHFKSSVFKNLDDNDFEISYEVDSPRSSSFGYLNAFLLKKQQQFIHSQNVKEIQFEKANLRPKSAPLIDQSLFSKTIHDITNKSSSIRSKSVTLDCENSDKDTSSTDDESIINQLNQTQNSRINIGITLDSRLRKTPVLDMLRSTTMQSDIIEPQQFNRTYSLRHSFVPIARF